MNIIHMPNYIYLQKVLNGWVIGKFHMHVSLKETSLDSNLPKLKKPWKAENLRVNFP